MCTISKLSNEDELRARQRARNLTKIIFVFLIVKAYVDFTTLEHCLMMLTMLHDYSITPGNINDKVKIEVHYHRIV